MNLSNPHEDSFQNFTDNLFFQRLEKKFEPLPYFRKYGALKRIALIASFLFNLLSGLTASSLIYFFIANLVKLNWIAYTITALIITLHELLKRKVNSTAFKDYLMTRSTSKILMITLLGLSLISITSSFYGSKKMVFEFSNNPTVTSIDMATLELQQQIDNLDAQILAARNTKWKGTTTTASQRTIESLSSQKDDLLSELIRVRKRTDTQNDKIQLQHKNTLQLNAHHFALVTLLFELLFIIAAFYLEYYDYRCYLEFKKYSFTNLRLPTESIDDITVTAPVAPGNIDVTILQAAIKNAKANLSAYKSKMKKGEGTVVSNQKGIKRWQKKIEELKKLLPENGTEIHANQ